MQSHRSILPAFFLLLIALVVAPVFAAFSQSAEEESAEKIGNDDCTSCHEKSAHETDIKADLAASSHESLLCMDCHQDKGAYPHKEDPKFHAGCDGCRACHEDAAQEYKVHGRIEVGKCVEMPKCSDCHGDHDILPSKVKLSKTHPVNLPQTCGHCHEDLNITRKYEILIDHPIQTYESSIHGKATKGGIYVAATCNDCHSTGGTSHKIYSPGNPESSINHFNIPKTCGKCHKSVENDYWEGIHGQLVLRGETDAPVCTHCHGEHGILAPDDPRSPVSRSRVAEVTCSPCHESVILNEKYGLPPGRLASFIDSYHGLKSKSGDPFVANCASCHGVHRILPSTDPMSTIYPGNLRKTCGACHPQISEKLAATPIHGIGGEGLRTPIADVVEKIYIIAIILIIGSMVLHWLIDLGRYIYLLLIRKPQVRRMTWNEVWQHTFLMITFIILVVSGFALRFGQSWVSRFFFGWEGGFELRGIVHRVAAVIFSITVVWHVLYLFLTHRGRIFFRDIWPQWKDFSDFSHRILYNLGLRKTTPQFGRFSYIEKAEYWALVWGTAIMIVSGILLWFDNWFVKYLPKGVLDVALVVHYWEAWLATLAIAIWHLYSTVFSPKIYPMNPSWITGNMPEEMYRHEHPAYIEEEKREMEQRIKDELKKMSTNDGSSEQNQNSV